MNVLENEADKMSMDASASASASCSEAPDDDVRMNDDPEDMTDDEDWAAVGAAALRAASYGGNSTGNFPSSNVYTTGGGPHNGASGKRRFAVRLSRQPNGTTTPAF